MRNLSLGEGCAVEGEVLPSFKGATLSLRVAAGSGGGLCRGRRVHPPLPTSSPNLVKFGGARAISGLDDPLGGLSGG